MMFMKKYCLHEYTIIRKKKYLIRKCVKCGHKIRYGAGLLLRLESEYEGN